MPGRETPSRVLVQALLEYSRRRRQTQNRPIINEEQRNLPQQEQQDTNAFRDDRHCSSGIGIIPVSVQTQVFVDVGGSGSVETIRKLSNIASSTLQSETDQKSIEDISFGGTTVGDTSFDDSTIGDTLNIFQYGDDGKIESISEQTAFVDSLNKERTKKVCKPVYSDSPLYFDKEIIAPEYSGNCFGSCFSSHQYQVQPELKDGDGPLQTAFIQKVFMILALKTFAILLWLAIVAFCDELRMHYKDYSIYHYISGVVYLIIKLVIRVMSNFPRRHCLKYICLFVLETIAASDFLESVVASHCSWITAHLILPRRILFCLLATYLFFIVVGAFVAYDMQDRVMIGTALIITGITAVYQFLHIKYTGDILNQLITSLAILGLSELFISMIMFELRSVLLGRRFPLASKDWFFTAIYVI